MKIHRMSSKLNNKKVSIQFLLTSPKPAIEGTDAVFQEIQAIQTAVDGTMTNLFPLQQPNSLFPRFLYGWHQWNTLKQQEQHTRVNHLYAPVLYYFPILKQLKNPLIYTVIASLKGRKKPSQIKALQQLSQIVVSNTRDYQILSDWGFHNHSLIRPGIATQYFQTHALPLQKEMVLLMASAPWEAAQFHSKGVDLLLEALQQRPFIKIIFLWRGFLYEEMLAKIKTYKVESQVHIINEKVQVNDILKQVHATVLLAETPQLVKAYPHSLIESIICGKPVLIGNEIPMADYVAERHCGLVIKNFTIHHLLEQLDFLYKNYAPFAAACQQLGTVDFSEKRMVEEYMKVYKTVDGSFA